jgi:hypothetical protein
VADDKVTCTGTLYCIRGRIHSKLLTIYIIAPPSPFEVVGMLNFKPRMTCGSIWG